MSDGPSVVRAERSASRAGRSEWGPGVLGIGLMAIAALCNAAASVLQRRASRGEPESAEFSVRIIGDLLRRPAWLLGVLAMVTGFVLHAVSISVSRIALVQPILIAELPFTLVMASWAFRLRIPRRDWLAVLLSSAGLAAFLGCLTPAGGDPARVPPAVWALAGGATVAAIVILVTAGYRGRREHRAVFLSIATGATFGLNSALIAGVGASVSGGTNLFACWQTYAVAVVGPAGFYLLQNALAAGNLVASQPGFTLTNPLVSVVWGLAVFGEQARGGPWLAGTVIGALLIGVGTVTLARSDLLNPETAPATDPGRGPRAAGRGRRFAGRARDGGSSPFTTSADRSEEG